MKNSHMSSHVSTKIQYMIRKLSKGCHMPGTLFTQAASFSLTMLAANFLPKQKKQTSSIDKTDLQLT